METLEVVESRVFDLEKRVKKNTRFIGILSALISAGFLCLIFALYGMI